MHTGGTAALTFGQAVVGVAPSVLRKQRRTLAAATVSTTGGGDLDLTLALTNGPRGHADLAFAAHEDPICHWAMAVWDEWFPTALLDKLVAGLQAPSAASIQLAAAGLWSKVLEPPSLLPLFVSAGQFTMPSACLQTTMSSLGLRLIRLRTSSALSTSQSEDEGGGR